MHCIGIFVKVIYPKYYILCWLCLAYFDPKKYTLKLKVHNWFLTLCQSTLQCGAETPNLYLFYLWKYEKKPLKVDTLAKLQKFSACLPVFKNSLSKFYSLLIHWVINYYGKPERTKQFSSLGKLTCGKLDRQSNAHWEELL